MDIIANWEHTRWIKHAFGGFTVAPAALLTLSSSFFCIPAIYAYQRQLTGYAVLLGLTSFISMNYWRHATYGWRRNLDLVFAKISFVVFVSNGVVYVRTWPYIITGYTGLLVLIYCYYLSNTLSEKNNHNWYKYHFLFHVIMTYEQYIIIDSINISKK